jgi:hypothetical protein
MPPLRRSGSSLCHRDAPARRAGGSASYRNDVAKNGGSKALAVAVYTVLRIALFLAVWLVLELLTPVHGIWAIVAAILMSGAISIVVLDRPRGRVGEAAAGFFGRINERIEASARAEDVDDGHAAPAPAPSESRDGESQSENQAVDQQ